MKEGRRGSRGEVRESYIEESHKEDRKAEVMKPKQRKEKQTGHSLEHTIYWTELPFQREHKSSRITLNSDKQVFRDRADFLQKDLGWSPGQNTLFICANYS